MWIIIFSGVFFRIMYESFLIPWLILDFLLMLCNNIISPDTFVYHEGKSAGTLLCENRFESEFLFTHEHIQGECGVLYSKRWEIPEAEYGSPASQGGCAKPKAVVPTDSGIFRTRSDQRERKKLQTSFSLTLIIPKWNCDKTNRKSKSYFKLSVLINSRHSSGREISESWRYPDRGSGIKQFVKCCGQNVRRKNWNFIQKKTFPPVNTTWNMLF